MEDKTIYECQVYELNGEGQSTNEPKGDTEEKETEEDKDDTVAPGSMPYTGGTFTIIVCVVLISTLGIYAYKRNKDLKGI